MKRVKLTMGHYFGEDSEKQKRKRAKMLSSASPRIQNPAQKHEQMHFR
jgi:hypothetical protein